MTTERSRMTPDKRYELLIETGLELAKEIGYSHVNRLNLADRANVSPSLISHYFGSTDALRDMLINKAVAREVLPVIAQGIAYGHIHAKHAPRELKKRALDYIVEG